MSVTSPHVYLPKEVFTEFMNTSFTPDEIVHVIHCMCFILNTSPEAVTEDFIQLTRNITSKFFGSMPDRAQEKMKKEIEESFD